MIKTLRHLTLTALFAVVGGCGADDAPPAAQKQLSPLPAAPSAPVAVFEKAEPREAPDKPKIAQASCREQIADVRQRPDLGGAPTFRARRPELLGVSQGEPVLFVRAPLADSEMSAVARSYRRKLFSSNFPNSVLDWFLPRARYQPKLGRTVVLTEGYLYAETPELAHAMTTKVELKHLFREPKIWIQRGAATIHAARELSGRYVYSDGALAGSEARILFLDRVGVVGEVAPPPLTRDIRELARRSQFERFTPTHITAARIVADVRYGNETVTALFATSGAQVTPVCELVSENRKTAVSAARKLAARRSRVLVALRRAIHEQIDAELPFDEPRRERGQQDGHLRRYWLAAYEAEEQEYLFNFDSYPVYSASGAARPPQVCIDFITETFERASGTFFRGAGLGPSRELGRVDFQEILGDERRRVARFVEFAVDSEWFDVLDVPFSERMPYEFKRRFLRKLARDSDNYRPGDIVVIRGYAPWDHYSTLHYHSFFVYESDPVSGMPITLVGNAGKPELRGWDKEMRRAPRRSIRYRIRPRTSWLESVLDLPAAASESGVRSPG